MKFLTTNSQISVMTPLGSFDSMRKAAKAHSLYLKDKKTDKMKPYTQMVQHRCQSSKYPDWISISKKDGTPIFDRVQYERGKRAINSFNNRQLTFNFGDK